jgi:1-acyl-sn-glycerol-3-phosphate acyltransferase
MLGLAIAAFVLPLAAKSHRPLIVKWWCKGLLKAFNIQVVTYGKLPPHALKGFMLVANHVSWADIHALNSLLRLRFIAKEDIKSWPVFGYLAKKTNALFIDRSKRQEAGRLVHNTVQSLLAGDNVAYFPEGTTSDGAQVLPFKSSVLQAAISANVQVWPVAIRYTNSDASLNKAMAYAGETTLVESMRAVLNVKNPLVELHFLAPIPAAGYDRRGLTLAAYQAISAKLAL